jgi:hypothetical protein
VGAAFSRSALRNTTPVNSGQTNAITLIFITKNYDKAVEMSFQTDG